MSQQLYSIYPGSWPLVAESRVIRAARPDHMDEYWSVGWRHFGSEFFRASLMADEMCLKRQVALRIVVPRFAMTKSQRRTYRRNSDLEVHLAPARPDRAVCELFHDHKKRFARNIPGSLQDFLGERPDGTPCECLQFSVYDGDRLLAASFMDVGREACSSIYAVYDPAMNSRRLGIYTMLCELQWASAQGYQYYYSGYATVESSCYDYKKQFPALEYYNWEGRWLPAETLMP